MTKLATSISITRAALIEKFNIKNPRLAITGLNPHAGEGGKMGSEEADVIIPTIEHLKAKGWQEKLHNHLQSYRFKEQDGCIHDETNRPQILGRGRFLE